MESEPKPQKILFVGRWYMLLVAFMLGVFISFAILYVMIPTADPSPWMGCIMMFCAGFFFSTTLLKSGYFKETPE